MEVHRPRTAHLGSKLLLLMLLGASGPAYAQRAGDSVVVREALEEDLYAAGRVVQIAAALTGDAVIAGELLSVSAPVTGDVLAAGREITFASTVSDDVRAAGDTLRFEAGVGGHAAAAGRSLVIAESANILDRAWLAGETIRVLGTIGGPLWAAGQRVEILGGIDGDVTVYGRELVVGDSARIDGSLTVRTELEPVISESAQIGGRVIYLPMEGEPAFDGAGLAMMLSLAAAAMLLFLIWPRLMEHAAATARGAPLTHLGTGALALVGVPILAMLLFVTVIGGWLGAGLIAAYIALVLFGFVTGLFVISDWALARWGRAGAGRLARIGAIAAAALLLWALSFIPVLGGLAMLTLLLSGIGALALSLYRAWRGGPAAALP